MTLPLGLHVKQQQQLIVVEERSSS